MVVVVGSQGDPFLAVSVYVGGQGVEGGNDNGNNTGRRGWAMVVDATLRCSAAEEAGRQWQASRMRDARCGAVRWFGVEKLTSKPMQINARDEHEHGKQGSP